MAESIQDVVEDGGTARVHHRRELRGHVPEYGRPQLRVQRRQHRPVPRLRRIGARLSMRSHRKESERGHVRTPGPRSSASTAASDAPAAHLCLSKVA